MTTYEPKYAIKMLKQSIDFAQAEGDFQQARMWSMRVEGVIGDLLAEIDNLNEGAKLLHSIATGGESKLLADWQTEAEALAADARSDADLVTELRGGG